MDSTVNRDTELSRERFAFSGFGEIYSFTTVLDPPEPFVDQSPYVLALVRLDEGPMVMAQLTDLDDEVQIGDRVEMVTRKLATEGKQGVIIYGYKFRKILERA